MEPAKKELQKAIEETNFSQGICKIYQNVTAEANSNPEEIKQNLIKQLTSSVKWTQTMYNMKKDGLSHIIEVGPGKVLQGLFKKMDREIISSSAIL